MSKTITESDVVRALNHTRAANIFDAAMSKARDALRHVAPSQERTMVETKLREAEFWFTELGPP